MTATRTSLGRRLVPPNFRDPIGLVRRILRSKDPAAYFAIYSTALSALATPLDMALAATTERRWQRDADAPRWPVIFVTGAPRSGTTVLSQVLIHHLPVTYFNNLTAVFPRAPITANRAFGRFLRKPSGALRSFYGRTHGFAAENDGLHLWDRWLADRYSAPRRLDPVTADSLRRFFAAYESAFGRPVLNKNNALATGADAIADALPTSHFLYIRREPLFAVQSILGARETIQGTREAPYGVSDPARRNAALSPIEQVCTQVLYHERRMEEQRRAIGDARFWVVQYEDFCRAPHAIVERAGREILGLTIAEGALQNALPPLRNTNRAALPASELAEIRDTLARLGA